MTKPYESQAARRLAGSAGITSGANYLDQEDALLTYLHWSSDAVAAIENGRLEAIGRLRLRDDPVSWGEIGRMLGVSKQAAQQRYGASD
jgi:hypothetical protein